MVCIRDTFGHRSIRGLAEIGLKSEADTPVFPVEIVTLYRRQRHAFALRTIVGQLGEDHGCEFLQGLRGLPVGNGHAYSANSRDAAPLSL